MEVNMRKTWWVWVPVMVFFSWSACAQGKSAGPSQQSVQGLIYDLKHPDAERRLQAAKLLGDSGVRAAVPALMEAASDSDGRVRLSALNALNQMRDPRALPVFVKMTSDTEAETRKTAINALVRLYVVDESGFVAGTKRALSFLNPFDSSYNDLMVEPYVAVSPHAVDAMAGRLDDPDPRVRKASVMGLGILRGRAAVPRMAVALPSETENGIKIEYMRSFYKIADAHASCGAVVPYINHPEKSVHDEAILTAGLLKCREAVAPLTALFESGVKEREKVLKVVPASSLMDLQIKCFQALALIADPRSEKLFIPGLRHANGDIRIAAAEGLARLGRTDNLPAVEGARQTAEGAHFQLALDYAMYRLGRKTVLGNVTSQLDGPRSGRAFGYLLELTSKEYPDLFPLLRGSRGKARVKILDVLGTIGGADALAEVESYTKDGNTDVASAALNAVRRIRARVQ